MTDEMMTTVPAWVLAEEVKMTPVAAPGDGNVIFLVVRTGVRSGGAITLHFDEGRILVNGKYVDLGDDPMAYSSMVDDAFPLGVTGADVGHTVTTAPYNG